jgi:hypothetical protein
MEQSSSQRMVYTRQTTPLEALRPTCIQIADNWFARNCKSFRQASAGHNLQTQIDPAPIPQRGAIQPGRGSQCAEVPIIPTSCAHRGVERQWQNSQTAAMGRRYLSLERAISTAEQQLSVYLDCLNRMPGHDLDECSPLGRNAATIRRLQTEILALQSSLALARSLEAGSPNVSAASTGSAIRR